MYILYIIFDFNENQLNFKFKLKKKKNRKWNCLYKKSISIISYNIIVIFSYNEDKFHISYLYICLMY